MTTATATPAEKERVDNRPRRRPQPTAPPPGEPLTIDRVVGPTTAYNTAQALVVLRISRDGVVHGGRALTGIGQIDKADRSVLVRFSTAQGVLMSGSVLARRGRPYWSADYPPPADGWVREAWAKEKRAAKITFYVSDERAGPDGDVVDVLMVTPDGDCETVATMPRQHRALAEAWCDFFDYRKSDDWEQEQTHGDR
jgi:hypothetical protein